MTMNYTEKEENFDCIYYIDRKGRCPSSCRILKKLYCRHEDCAFYRIHQPNVEDVDVIEINGKIYRKKNTVIVNELIEKLNEEKTLR